MKALLLALAVGVVGCGPQPQADGWRGIAWQTPHDHAAKRLSDVEFKWRMVDSSPPPDFDAISDPRERAAARMLHYGQHPRVKDRTLPPQQISGTLREGPCFYQVGLRFNDDGGLHGATEDASLHCSDAAKNELAEKFGKPTFSEVIPPRDCGMSYARGVMETIAWTKGDTRAVYERRCGASRFTVEYSSLRH
ncbi:hypothetical protein [Bordetella trematum]|uniref:hypothetical protein n=1 Tax=Bordetella trematum TaxID=123899 RepID=UPI0012684E2E|nr:hypothetical protein [Bordetella trematum]